MLNFRCISHYQRTLAMNSWWYEGNQELILITTPFQRNSKTPMSAAYGTWVTMKCTCTLCAFHTVILHMCIWDVIFCAFLTQLWWSQCLLDTSLQYESPMKLVLLMWAAQNSLFPLFSSNDYSWAADTKVCTHQVYCK